MITENSNGEFVVSIQGYAPYYINKEHELYNDALVDNLCLSLAGNILCLKGLNGNYCLNPTPTKYQLINDIGVLQAYVDTLPNLEVGEKYYVQLLARQKYNNDRNILSSLKLQDSFVKKEVIVDMVKSWELPYGSYTTKKGDIIDNDSLVVYISPNPKSTSKAYIKLLENSESILVNNKNLLREANTCYFNSISRKTYKIVDIDLEKQEELAEIVAYCKSILNESCLRVVRTRSGIHLLIELSKTPKTQWHKEIMQINSLFNVKEINEIAPYGMTPLVGTIQGGVVPIFI